VATDGNRRRQVPRAVGVTKAKSVKQPSAFGKVLRDLRVASGISQAELARNAMVSAGYVGLIETGERGERPSLDIVKRFAQGVSANVEELESLMRAAGHLGQHESLVDSEQPTVPSIVERDRFLSRKQKQILVMLYEDMRRRSD
jgi:transcriptional regulator with XRE-family HTH domain